MLPSGSQNILCTSSLLVYQFLATILLTLNFPWSSLCPDAHRGLSLALFFSIFWEPRFSFLVARPGQYTLIHGIPVQRLLGPCSGALSPIPHAPPTILYLEMKLPQSLQSGGPLVLLVESLRAHTLHPGHILLRLEFKLGGTEHLQCFPWRSHSELCS